MLSGGKKKKRDGKEAAKFHLSEGVIFCLILQNLYDKIFYRLCKRLSFIDNAEVLCKSV